jgi:hypothetical protein
MTQLFQTNVLIDGSSDTSQLTIQGHSIQTTPLQSWQTSNTTDLARLTGDGRLQVGSFDNGMMATDDALIEAHRHEDDTARPKRGLHLKGGLTGPLSSIVTWVMQELVLKGTGGISALHTALRVKLRNENTAATGTMTGAELRAADIEVINAGGATAANKRVPEITGLRVSVTNEQTGHAETAYGVKVEVNNAGTLGKAYAIYTGTGIVYGVVEAPLLLQNQTITQSLAIPAGYQTIYAEELLLGTDGELIIDGALFVF